MQNKLIKEAMENKCVYVCVLYAKCVTFVSAWIQSCCVSCVSAPTISTRSVCRYSSTVNTALPETQLLDIWNGKCPRKHLNLVTFCTHIIKNRNADYLWDTGVSKKLKKMIKILLFTCSPLKVSSKAVDKTQAITAINGYISF